MMKTEILVSFETTQSAIFAEKLTMEAGIKVSIMPLPSAIKAECGMCLRMQEENLEQAEALLQRNAILYKKYQIDGSAGSPAYREL